MSPTGDDAAAGTESAPVRTLAKALSLAGPGDRIRVLAGTYAERVLITDSVRAGTAEAPITLEGVDLPRIVPGSQPGALVAVERPHWLISGFEIDVQNKAAFAVAFSGDTEGTVLSDSEVHHAQYGAGISFHNGAHGATLEKNHIHHISIPNKDAHGVMIQPTSRNITVRDNVIHDNSGDSIQCYSTDGSDPSTPADGLLIEGNDLYGNIEQSIDIKTCYNVTIRRNKMHKARRHPTLGGNGAMVVHLSARDVLIEENDFYDAGLAIGIGGNRYGPYPSGIVIRRNLIRDMLTEGGMTGGGLQLAVSQGTQLVNNTFTRLPGPAIIMGNGDGGPTESLVVKNNIIDVPQAMQVGSQAPGLTTGSNLYRTGATFLKAGAALNLSQWQAQGQDGNSREEAAPLDPKTLSPGPAAVDRGERLDLEASCGAGPDIGAVESNC
ncbi:right-handed parallel beta-helix repeat-containing protein [Corallococcus sicarius]|uniref:right-handed parallel beta-helix repeat-containing protein n=1 Tax=Corallococcus sicarius TaxID=2316726 RepID=UPI0013155396|nr:right-handed parallel beta-helix repeat-containing protein [Corallococcus sicarius]